MLRPRIAAILALAFAGCFYLDPVNTAPKASIQVSDAPVLKGTTVAAWADASSDADGDPLQYVWSARQCVDPSAQETCVPLGVGVTHVFTFVPASKRPILVDLIVTDVYTARGVATVTLQPANRAPSLTVDAQGLLAAGTASSYTIGRSIDVYATGDDPDGVSPTDPSGDTLTYVFELQAPAGSDPLARGWQRVGAQHYVVRPDIPGAWSVRVTLSDGDGGEVDQTVGFTVLADAPPCLGALTPAVPAGTTVIVEGSDPRRFAVLAVDDDLDPYPLPVDSGDPLLGSVHFRWSVAEPGAATFARVVGHDLADLEFDPSAYLPGDRPRVRVEIADRVPRALPCGDDEATCSIGGDLCTQRMTWTVEVR